MRDELRRAYANHWSTCTGSGPDNKTKTQRRRRAKRIAARLWKRENQ